MTAVISRIILRYLAGALIAKGLIDASMGKQLATDADALYVLDVALGFAIAIGTEGFYWLAKKLGWRT